MAEHKELEIGAWYTEQAAVEWSCGRAEVAKIQLCILIGSLLTIRAKLDLNSKQSCSV